MLSLSREHRGGNSLSMRHQSITEHHMQKIHTLIHHSQSTYMHVLGGERKLENPKTKKQKHLKAQALIGNPVAGGVGPLLTLLCSPVY